MQKFLIIQTAFTGDVVLATAVVEKLYQYYPNAQIDFLVRKGNEFLLLNNPKVNKTLIWHKQKYKIKNLFQIIVNVRKEQYSYIINLQRFVSSGLITWLSGANFKFGFDKNPFSFCFTQKFKHVISVPYNQNPVHEIDRNQLLIAGITDNLPSMPKLYPSKEDYELVAPYKKEPYICIAPSSVWFTKQFPESKWVELIKDLPKGHKIYLLGGPSDALLAESILSNVSLDNVKNCCGKFSFLQSAALMQDAAMNYVNDSAPLHFASAMQAKVTAIFCSTVPAFGFGPLIFEKSRIIEIEEKLDCRPCGIHGLKSCPKGHFNCAHKITNKQLLWWI